MIQIDTTGVLVQNAAGTAGVGLTMQGLIVDDETVTPNIFSKIISTGIVVGKGDDDTAPLESVSLYKDSIAYSGLTGANSTFTISTINNNTNVAFVASGTGGTITTNRSIQPLNIMDTANTVGTANQILSAGAAGGTLSWVNADGNGGSFWVSSYSSISGAAITAPAGAYSLTNVSGPFYANIGGYITIINSNTSIRLTSLTSPTLTLTQPEGWALRTSNFVTTNINGVIYGLALGKGLFIAGGNNGTMTTSPDTSIWNPQTSGFGSTQINSIAYGIITSTGVGIFVAVGNLSGASPIITTSPDGITWTVRTIIYGDNLNSIVYGLVLGVGLFVAVGNSGNTISTSLDGVTWVSQPNIPSSYVISGIAYGFVTGGGDLFVTGGDGGIMTTSPDGITWTQRTSSFGSTSIFSIGYGAGLFVAVGGVGGG